MAIDQSGSGDHLNAVYDGRLGIAEVIENDRLHAGFDQAHNHVGADVAGAAGNKNVFFHRPQETKIGAPPEGGCQIIIK